MSILKKDVTPNTVEKTVTKGGVTIEETVSSLDPFPEVLKEDGMAQVSCTYAMGVDHNSEKVTFFVSIRCDQNEKAINRAGEIAFNKAVEFVAEAADVLGWKKTS